MAAVQQTWRWDPDSFVRAWEAGVFGDQRVEMIEGAVVPVVIGMWHGIVTMRVARLLPEGEDSSWRALAASLPYGGSVPDPDCWVLRRGAEPVASLGKRLSRWSPDDVGLVVEVADESLSTDLGVKSEVYGGGGVPTYWVVHRSGVEVFTDPHPRGYHQRHLVPRGERVDVPYLPRTTLAVDDLLDVD